jgi:hypothetical protein
MAVPKHEMCEFEKAMFLGFVSTCEIIFCLLGIQKCDLNKFEEMFQVVELISCHLASRNYDLFEFDKAMFHGFDTTCDRIVCLLADRKCDFGEIEKTMFEVVDWH